MFDDLIIAGTVFATVSDVFWLKRSRLFVMVWNWRERDGLDEFYLGFVE